MPVGLLGQCPEHGHVGEVRAPLCVLPRRAAVCHHDSGERMKACAGIRSLRPPAAKASSTPETKAVVVEQRQPSQHAAARVHVAGVRCVARSCAITLAWLIIARAAPVEPEVYCR